MGWNRAERRRQCTGQYSLPLSDDSVVLYDDGHAPESNHPRVLNNCPPLRLCIPLVLLVCYMFLCLPLRLPLPPYPADPSVLIDSVVYISLPPYPPSITLSSIHSLRYQGHYDGPVYILTTDVSPFNANANIDDLVVVIEVPPTSNPKSLKCSMFSHLPPKVDQVLYIDSDIELTSPIAPLAPYLTKFSAFQDCGGHYIGWCSGCDPYHTGVLTLHRTNSLLRPWCDALPEYPSDQSAFASVASPSVLPYQFITFSKDYLRRIAGSTHSIFYHKTGLHRS